MNSSAEQINSVLDYQLTRIKQLEKDLAIAVGGREQAERSEERIRAYLRKSYDDLKQVNKELLQTKKALRMLINAIEVEKTHDHPKN